MDGLAKKRALDEESKQVPESDSEMDKVTCMLVKEVLETMGRSKDYSNVLARLQAHLITSNEDILALTKDYCRETDLPWGLVLALKGKIRSYNIQLGDAWSMQDDEKMANVQLSLAAPHIAKDKKKIEYVVRKQTSKGPDDLVDNASETTSRPGYPRSPRFSETLSSQSPFADTQSWNGSSNDEVKKLASIMQEHQKSVNGQVDECRDFVMQSMDKIMGVLEQRMMAENNIRTPAKATANPASAPVILQVTGENVAQPAM
jgi:hypothetical protein